MARLRALPPLASSLPPLVPVAPKQTDAELGTAAHRTWARQVKERAGYRCQDPEHDRATPRSGPGVALYADHVEERQDAPHRALDPLNGMCRCASCHVRKTHRARAARHGA
ncbi:HNH endonuclease [Bosea sp. WAO]|uniref:HNH endonuclease n=1 Tax=Bosea sp. WAO TaxID=406341 RepID=UPI0009F87762|nr:HNH endonuclease [Bosea sp. WAO]